MHCHGFEEPPDTHCLQGLNLGLWFRAPEIFEEEESSRESWVLVWATLDIIPMEELNEVNST